MTEVAPALLGGLLLAASVGALRHLLARRGAYQSGPWPGLTARGAWMLLAHAALLAGGLLLLGPVDVRQDARAALPWLPVQAALGLAPLALAARTLAMPGALSGVAGAYLLPRSLVALVAPTVAPPLALWPAAFALDLLLWAPRRWPAERRALIGGAAAGLLLGIVEPTYEMLLGAPAAAWSVESAAVAALASVVVGAVTVWGVLTRSGLPGREWRQP